MKARRMRGWHWALAAILGAAVIGAAYLAFTGTDPVELVELLTHDGERQLREPMRPARAGTRVLVLAIDGLGDEPLRDALARNALPRLAAVYRGADLLTLPDLRVLGDLVGVLAEGVAGEETASLQAFQRLDESATESLLERLRTDGVPDLQVVYFPGIDLYTHVATQPLDAMRRYLAEVLDPAIGSILDEYRRQRALDQTYVLVVSDHGHTPVLNVARHALGTDPDNDPPAVLARAGFRVRPFELDQRDDDDFQATLAYQGAIAYVYLADRSTCPQPGDVCDWRRAPRLQEDVLPVVRAFDEANRTGAGAPNMRGALDLIFAREPRAPGTDAVPFDVWDGTRLVPIGDALDARPRPDLLALEPRRAALATRPFEHRAGDVLLLAPSGANRPIEDRFYFSHEYHSWHGSPTAGDSHIAFLLAREGPAGAELRRLVHAAAGEQPSQLDITPMILHLLAR